MPDATADAARAGQARIRSEQFGHAPQGQPDHRRANHDLAKSGDRLAGLRLRVIYLTKHESSLLADPHIQRRSSATF